MYLLASTHASNFVSDVDGTFLFVLSVCFFFLIGLTILMIWFIYRYNSKRNPRPTQIKGSNALEIIWTVIPTILVVIMFYFGWMGWKPMKEPPKDTFDIKVTARMWNFSFIYDNGKRTDTLFVPLDQPVKLNLEAVDVIHSLYIPAFRIKQDIVPGRDQFAWFIPQREGTYELFCAEYCGLQHSYMYNWVKVMPKADFEKWYSDTTAQTAAAGGGGSPTAAGKSIMTSIGCFACHTADGSKLVGPSFKGMYGSPRTVNTGGQNRQVTADDAYIKHSILDPNADIVEGFPKGMMQSYQGQLSDEDIAAITEYLKTLK